MTSLAIRWFPDPILKQPTDPIVRLDSPIRKLIDHMIATMRAHPRCVGLAAPQVGSPLRIAVMDATGHPKTTSSLGLIVLVNPQLLEADGEVIQREGCLSVPDVTANVRRSARVRVKAFDRFGASREWRLEGFEAIIAQHEIDHLDGLLFLDRVANLATDVFRRKTYF